MRKDQMTENEAKEYLERKGKEATPEETKKVMQEGKIYGDPKAYIKW